VRFGKICLLLPTYGRSKTDLPRFIESAINTLEDRNQVHFHIMCNIKDMDSIHYCTDTLKGYNMSLVTENTSTPHLANYFNQLYSTSYHQWPQSVAAMVGDDMEFVTYGWDTKILKHIDAHDGIGWFYCSGDERFDDALCVNLFMTRKMVALTGGQYMASEFPANGIDMVHQLAADATGLDYYIENVTILHHQYARKGKDGWDETYHRLSPCRKLAIRRKQREVVHATKMVKSLVNKGIVDKSCIRAVVPHLQHKREGRNYLK
jgi:hypothetical protein